MELWIRSQKNTEADIVPALVKANEIYLDYCGENDSYYISVNDGKEIGYYQSKKRALEVLDEIQKLLEPKFILQTKEIRKPITEFMYKIEEMKDIKELSTYVYEMPEE